MASVSEKGFGAKIRKAQDLLVAINNFPVYAPPRDEESIAEMTYLVDEIIQLNADETVFKENYRIAVDNRQRTFHDRPDSIEKLLSPVANAVKAQYGSNSKQTALVKEQIRKMRAQRSSKSQETGIKPPTSTSETSFGSLTKTFGDLVLTLTQFADYAPSNPDITLEALQQKVQDLTILSDAVMSTTVLLKSVKEERAEKYDVLRDRIVRIKAYIKAHYGNGSAQYELIRKL